MATNLQSSQISDCSCGSWTDCSSADNAGEPTAIIRTWKHLSKSLLPDFVLAHLWLSLHLCHENNCRNTTHFHVASKDIDKSNRTHNGRRRYGKSYDCLKRTTSNLQILTYIHHLFQLSRDTENNPSCWHSTNSTFRCRTAFLRSPLEQLTIYRSLPFLSPKKTKDHSTT